jgi:hypothetical protein
MRDTPSAALRNQGGAALATCHPFAAMAPEPPLITLSISPFNEPRWSLERAGISYREEPQALVWHVIASRRAGGKGTTPLLIADDEVMAESAEIADCGPIRRESTRCGSTAMSAD